MDIELGKPVVSSDGKRIGTVDRLIVDPRTWELDELIVQRGLWLSEDRIVERGFIDHVAEDGTVLSEVDTTDMDEGQTATQLNVLRGMLEGNQRLVVTDQGGKERELPDRGRPVPTAVDAPPVVVDDTVTEEVTFANLPDGPVTVVPPGHERASEAINPATTMSEGQQKALGQATERFVNFTPATEEVPNL